MNDNTLAVAGRNSRLVLLPVDPHSIHVYWQIASPALDAARKEAGTAQVLLRLYKSAKAEDAPVEYFDVEVDLRARNWYVHLWRPEAAFRADLGLGKKDGTFIRLARSQAVEMPRPVPTSAVDRHFMKVEDAEPRPEIVPPPPAPVEERQHRYVQPRTRSEPTVELRAPKPIGYPEIVKEKLQKLYTSLPQRRRDHVIEPEPPPPVASSVASARTSRADLATLAENKLVTGLSSGSLQTDRQKSPSSSKQ